MKFLIGYSPDGVIWVDRAIEASTDRAAKRASRALAGSVASFRFIRVLGRRGSWYATPTGKWRTLRARTVI